MISVTSHFWGTAATEAILHLSEDASCTARLLDDCSLPSNARAEELDEYRAQLRSHHASAPSWVPHRPAAVPAPLPSLCPPLSGVHPAFAHITHYIGSAHPGESVLCAALSVSWEVYFYAVELLCVFVEGNVWLCMSVAERVAGTLLLFAGVAFMLYMGVCRGFVLTEGRLFRISTTLPGLAWGFSTAEEYDFSQPVLRNTGLTYCTTLSGQGWIEHPACLSWDKYPAAEVRATARYMLATAAVAAPVPADL